MPYSIKVAVYTAGGFVVLWFSERRSAGGWWDEKEIDTDFNFVDGACHYSVQHYVSAGMKVQVVDENGTPYKGQLVRQSCYNYTLGVSPCSGADDSAKLTDENGYVVFPERKINLSVLSRVARSIFNFLNLFVHGSYGVDINLDSSGPQGYRTLRYVPGEPMPTVFLLPSKEATKKFTSSKLAYSDNGKFVLVLVSNDSLEDHAERTRKSWEPLNLSPQEQREYEKNLSDTLAEEMKIRNSYPSSGLFLKSDPKKALWKIPPPEAEKWLRELDGALIADDGTYAVGYNPEVAETENGSPNKAETGVFIYSSGFGSLSYKVSELTEDSDKFRKTSEGYRWAEKEPIIENKTFTLVKQNGSKLKFDLVNGAILYADPEGNL